MKITVEKLKDDKAFYCGHGWELRVGDVIEIDTFPPEALQYIAEPKASVWTNVRHGRMSTPAESED